MTQRLVVLGGPGDGLSVAEAIHHVTTDCGSLSLVGFLNDVLPRGTILQGVPVLGQLDDWRELDQDVRFVPALQKVKDMPGRVRRVEGLGIPDDRWGVVIHPSAVVSSDVEIGVGSFILSCATIQPAARVGRFVGVRSGAMLGHHCMIGDHASVGPNATMCGRSILHEAAHLGPGAVLMDAKVMGRYSVAGIGAAVTKDVPDYWIVFGNPARRVGWVERSVDLQSLQEMRMTSLRNEIVEIITRTSKPQVPDLRDDNKPLLQAGLDSLDYASVLMAIEDRYRLEIVEDDIENLASLQDIVTFIKARISRAS